MRANNYEFNTICVSDNLTQIHNSIILQYGVEWNLLSFYAKREKLWNCEPSIYQITQHINSNMNPER